MVKVNKQAQTLGKLGGRPKNENRQASVAPKSKTAKHISKSK